MTDSRAVVLFVSDIHLSAQQPRTAAAILRFLSLVPARAGSLTILGDLFDSWAGDDDLDDPFIATVVAGLRALASAGVTVQLMRGNRDFLLGEDFARASGLSLLEERHRIGLPDGRPCLLSHGDALCTDDTAYQAFRTMVRDPAWQQAFLARPLAERKGIIAGLRTQSEANKQTKSMAVMDINPQSVARWFIDTGTVVLIHGHTHRPGRNCLRLGDLELTCERHVLTDWDFDGLKPRGGGLAVDADGIHEFSWTEAQG